MGAVVEADGRHRRKANNREAVVDALVELFAAGNYAPTANDIAERAGISVRSLFRYFDDVDDLVRAAVERQLAAIEPYRTVDVPAGASRAEKVDALVASRMAMHEAVAATARAGRLVAHRHPVIAARLGEVRRRLREQVRDLFGDEWAPVLPAADALCSFETYDLLRHGHGMSRAKVTAAITRGLDALLEVKR